MPEDSYDAFIVEEGTNEWLGKIPDPDTGICIEETFTYFYKYIVEEEPVTEEVVIREYPNGGKDVEIIEIVPGKGYWIIEDVYGNILDWPIDSKLIENLDKNMINEVRSTGYIFHKFDEEEKEEHFKQKALYEKQEKRFFLQKELDSSDYIAAKFVDRLLLLEDLEDLPVLIDEFRSDYSEALLIRQEQRDEINAIESKEV